MSAKYTLRTNGSFMVTKRVGIHIEKDFLQWVREHTGWREKKAIVEVMRVYMENVGHLEVCDWCIETYDTGTYLGVSEGGETDYRKVWDNAPAVLWSMP